MNEQEIIEYLKKNKEDCVIFMKMPQPVQDWCKENAARGIFLILGDVNKWSKPQIIACANTTVYALPDDYELPKVEPEILECDVDDDLKFEIGGWYLDIASLNSQIIDLGIYYRFIGYKFEGFPSVYNEYLKYPNEYKTALFDSNGEGTRKPVYANKVVYMKVGDTNERN